MGRMRAVPADTAYEVYCQRCRVSFPVGTRSCLHCGLPVGRRAAPAALPAHRPGAPADDEALEEMPVRALKASPMTLVWLLAGVATIAYRACNPQ
jgi:hypothetical protein